MCDLQAVQSEFIHRSASYAHKWFTTLPSDIYFYLENRFPTGNFTVLHKENRRDCCRTYRFQNSAEDQRSRWILFWYVRRRFGASTVWGSSTLTQFPTRPSCPRLLNPTRFEAFGSSKRNERSSNGAYLLLPLSLRLLTLTLQRKNERVTGVSRHSSYIWRKWNHKCT